MDLHLYCPACFQVDFQISDCWRPWLEAEWFRWRGDGAWGDERLDWTRQCENRATDRGISSLVADMWKERGTWKSQDAQLMPTVQASESVSRGHREKEESTGKVKTGCFFFFFCWYKDGWQLIFQLIKCINIITHGSIVHNFRGVAIHSMGWNRRQWCAPSTSAWRTAYHPLILSLTRATHLLSMDGHMSRLSENFATPLETRQGIMER